MKKKTLREFIEARKAEGFAVADGADTVRVFDPAPFGSSICIYSDGIAVDLRGNGGTLRTLDAMKKALGTPRGKQVTR